MAMPFLPATADPTTGSLEANLVTSPSHADVQAHLNALLGGVVSAAGGSPAVWQPEPPPPSEQSEGASESKPESRTQDGCGSALHRLLANSGAYGAAIRGLDHQLRLSFKAMERRLQAVRKQLDPMFLSQSATLSALYLNRSGLFQQILEAGSKEEPAKCIPAECHTGTTQLGCAFLADFLMLWLAGPRSSFLKTVENEKLSIVLLNVFYSVAKALAALITESVEGQGQGAAALHRALASVSEGSGRLDDALFQALIRPELFTATTEHFGPPEPDLIARLCEWLVELRRCAERWEEAVQGTRALSQCGPFALDLRFVSFMLSQVAPSLMALTAFSVNLFAVSCGRRLWKNMNDLLARLNNPVASLEDMVHELELLSNVYQNLSNFQNDRQQLTPLLASLGQVTRTTVLARRLSDVRTMGHIGAPGLIPEAFFLDLQEEATVEAGADEEVGTLKCRAQTALGVGRGLHDRDSLTLHVNRVEVRANRSAFAVILGDGSVVTWGNGGDSRAVQDQLNNVRQIQASNHAFVAILGDGSVVTWGDPHSGGDSRAVQDQLNNVRQIRASDYAFAAILGDGSVVTWGDPHSGGDSRAVQDQLNNVRQIRASDYAFAAILGDGSVVTWGAHHGGDSSAVQDQLRTVRQIQASDFAFAAILGDGSVVTWGDPRNGGDSRAVQDQLKNVEQIQASGRAFAAVLGDGSRVTWGESDDRAATDEDGEGADSSSLERSRAQGVGHPYGGLATGAVQFLGLRLDYVLKKLQVRLDQVLATLPTRSEPFQRLVEEEGQEIAKAAQQALAQLEEQLSPSASLAIDARCNLTRVGAGEATEQQDNRRGGEGENNAAATLQLTRGGLSSLSDVQSALAAFDQRFRELDSRNRLMNRFHDLAKGSGSISASVPRSANEVTEELRGKLAEFRVFWRATQEWDKEVEKRLRQSPALVNIPELQRQAHATLRAASNCPQEHQKLLRQRINAFRQVFRQLFMVQSIMALHAPADSSEVLYAPPQAHVWSNLFHTPVNIKAKDVALKWFGIEDGSRDQSKASANIRGEAPGFDPNDTMTTLGRLLRAGVLDHHGKVARQYALATRESHEMQSLLWNVIAWSCQPLPIATADAIKNSAGTPVLPVADAVLEQLETRHRGLGHAIRRARPYPQLFNRRADEAVHEEVGPGPDEFFLGSFYRGLAETWIKKLSTMRANLVRFAACQTQWLRLAPLLRGGALPTGPSLTNLQKGDAIFQTLANEMAASPQTRTCLEDVLGSRGDASNGHRIEQASKYFSEALRFIKADLEDLRRRCVRLLLLEDEELLLLWGSPALSVEQQEVIVSNSLPRLFPGCTKWNFARRGSAGGEKVRRLKSSNSELTRGGTAERRTVRRDLAVVTAAPSSGPVLELLEPVTLSIQLPDWMDKLEQAIRTSFTGALASLTSAPRPFLTQRLAEASRATRSTACKLEPPGQAAESDDVGDVSPVPEHVSVTAERIRWTSLVEAWSSYPDALALLSWHVENRLGEEVARNTASTPDSVGVGAVLMLMLELRALLLRAKAENHQARDLVFLRIAWRGTSSVAAALGPVTLEFGWELYGGDVLVCPVGEENFVEVMQHLASLRCPVLQGSSSCSVVLGLAATCGIACHQCYILSDTSSFESLRRVGAAAALLGHWVILHGVDQLERNSMEVCQKFLSRLFQRLAASLEVFRDRLHPQPQTDASKLGSDKAADRCLEAWLPSRPASKASNRSTTPAPRFAAQPPGSITVRNVHCVFDFAKLRIEMADKILDYPNQT
ncbi:hypothetical protein AK812_SmicGene37186 [Symbiodinium microadriaticum]|uniref:E3 ubiquitin-protein ligase HERC2 n=1 Tax=Symbiodinium microadriaticum TaxID=2951 RepID=A0A1Q9CGX5_SYMMI|nr:hypothetical protein AK812_SmicGene37186 [Symbiodinium microadriaticum]